MAMTPERWQRVKELFQSIVDLPPEERTVLLRARTEGDPELRAEVISLLESHHTESGFLEEPPLDLEEIEREDAELEAGVHIGPYRVVRTLGRGGMGVVYLAVRDDDAFQKEVAIKVVKRGMDHDPIVKRFRNERQILAGLDHPGIAKLLDGGTTDDGRPYLVMELVEGQPIVQYCQEQGLPLSGRLALFQRVCAAVQYAHQNLLVHRDLKPANILVTPDGHPKLLDFGIAKILDPTGPDADVTITALRALTPQYASPEQVKGLPITTASDVYTLGLLLYELLVGERPYQLTSQAPEALVRAVCEQEPERPSKVTGNKELAGDLDTIVLKALHKDPARRYSSVEQLSEDVRRHLEGLPVLARPDSVGYRTTKFVRRHRAGVAAAALAVSSLVVGLGMALWQARVANMERTLAEKRFNDVRTLAGSFLFEFHDAIYGLEGSLPAKRLIVERGLQYLEALAAEAGTDEALRIELARAYYNLAGIQGSAWRAKTLGDSAGAMSSLRRGLEILGPLDETRLDEVQQRAKAVEIARLLEELGKLQMMTGDMPGAAESHRAMMAMHEVLGKGHTLEDQAKNGILQAYQTAGDSWWYAGDWARAHNLYETSAAAARRLDESVLPPGIVVGELGSALWRVGLMRFLSAEITMARLGDVQGREALRLAAQEADREGLEARAACLAVEPASAFYRRLLGESYLHMGTIYATRGETSVARERFAKALSLSDNVGEPSAIARILLDWVRSEARADDGASQLRDVERALHIYQEAAAADANNDQGPHMVGVALEDLADVQLRLGHSGDAEQALRSALETYARILKVNPRGGYVSDYARTATRLAEVLIASGRREGAVEATSKARSVLTAIAEPADALPAAVSETAWFLLSGEPHELRDPVAALGYAERAFAMPSGDSPDATAVLAVARFQNGDVDGAVEAALRTYRLMPLGAAGRDEKTLHREIPIHLKDLDLRPTPRIH